MTQTSRSFILHVFFSIFFLSFQPPFSSFEYNEFIAKSDTDHSYLEYTNRSHSVWPLDWNFFKDQSIYHKRCTDCRLWWVFSFFFKKERVLLINENHKKAIFKHLHTLPHLYTSLFLLSHQPSIVRY